MVARLLRALVARGLVEDDERALAVRPALAAEVTARAVLNAVRAAAALADPPLPAARDFD